MEKQKKKKRISMKYLTILTNFKFLKGHKMNRILIFNIRVVQKYTSNPLFNHLKVIVTLILVMKKNPLQRT